MRFPFSFLVPPGEFKPSTTASKGTNDEWERLSPFTVGSNKQLFHTRVSKTFPLLCKTENGPWFITGSECKLFSPKDAQERLIINGSKDSSRWAQKARLTDPVAVSGFICTSYAYCQSHTWSCWQLLPQGQLSLQGWGHRGCSLASSHSESW